MLIGDPKLFYSLKESRRKKFVAFGCWGICGILDVGLTHGSWWGSLSPAWLNWLGALSLMHGLVGLEVCRLGGLWFFDGSWQLRYMGCNKMVEWVQARLEHSPKTWHIVELTTWPV
ncbi:hypothetical protein VNO77_14364 [Canavalia gladiata]|uniref:Transmembrane protein n=1 Tax=Canavalia gladiata TaxID=3824 RepID=A0AAN9QNP2_CANGL